jgi:hypothetical protein
LRTETENPENTGNNLSDNTGMISQPLKIQPGFSARLNLTTSLSFKLAVNPGYLAGTEIFQTSTYLQRRREFFDPDYAIKRTRSVRSLRSMNIIWQASYNVIHCAAEHHKSTRLLTAYGLAVAQG